uniref:Putative C-terminal domain small phosphatase isoform X2 n=1 Tax=Rhizophora mucronata TaxID=61149 RepID=A0A2P2L947_RHIMU
MCKFYTKQQVPSLQDFNKIGPPNARQPGGTVLSLSPPRQKKHIIPRGKNK